MARRKTVHDKRRTDEIPAPFIGLPRGFYDAALLRKQLGIANRRKPGPLPHNEERAFRKIVNGTEMTPAELVQTLMNVLIDEYQDATLLGACAWFDPGIIARQAKRDAKSAIILRRRPTKEK